MKSFFIIIDKLSTNKYFLWVLTTFLIITLLISFLLKINLSNLFGVFSYNEYLLDKGIETKDGGVVSDLRTHWEYIILLKKDLSNLLNLTLGVDTNLINYPLHNLIFSQFGFINSLDSYLISVFTISFNQLIKSCDIGLSSVMVSRSLIKNNLFSNLKTKEDYLLWFKLNKHLRSFIGINKCLVYWRQSENSLSSSNIQKLCDAFKLYKNHLNLSFFFSIYCVYRLSMYALIKKYIIYSKF